MEHRDIQLIIGLGNPGAKYKKNRHNIGFLVVDALAEHYHAVWQHKDQYDRADIKINDKNVILLKPLTFMNASGNILPAFTKKGIKPEQILVVHDEMEKPLGSLQIRLGGSARGHNGLKSIMNHISADFYRLRFGVGRPERKEDVSDWVLGNFDASDGQLQHFIAQAVDLVSSSIQT
jgi:PTH1 family peptidyl-tRNA hydrolase